MLEMRTSERGSLKKCPQQWAWGNLEGLRPNREATPLWFGTAIHQALAEYYIPGTVRGRDLVETFESFLSGERKMIVTSEQDEREYVDARLLGIDMLTRYQEHYGLEPNKDYIASEYAGSVLMARPERQLFGTTQPAQKRWLRYHFTWDGVYRDLETGEIWLDEHKTAASIWNDQLPLDDQAGSYWAVATPILQKRGVLEPGQEIAGIMYNFMRKAMGDTRPVNEDGLRTNKPGKQNYIDALSPLYELTGKETISTLEELVNDYNEGLAQHGDPEPQLVVLGDPSASQPPPYFERFPVYRSRGERATMLRRIKDEAFFSEAYRNGDLPITKSPSLMNCRFCDFKRMCELDEQGDKLSVEEFKESQYRKVDPYLAYRKGTE